MSWEDRLIEAVLESPSGVRVRFDFENVSRIIEPKSSLFEFPDADGTFVQRNGNTGRSYPLRVFFSGGNHDLEADIFDAALLEPGIIKLEHPRYGIKNVIPFGPIIQRDDLKTAANQSVIEVIFWETIELIFPTSQDDPASQVLIAIGEYNSAVSESFADNLILDTAIQRITVQNQYLALLDQVKSSLQPIADAQDNVRRQFNTINSSINQGIDVLIGQPLTLAFQTVQLIQAPGRAIVNIRARLDAYKDLTAIILNGNEPVNTNELNTNRLYLDTYTTGSIVSVVNNQFTTKTEALTAAQDIITQFDDVTAFNDANDQLLDVIDTGESYQKLQEAVALTAGFLVQISFSLKQERRVVLDRDRTIVDLSAELYGSVDDQLDFLITSNDLTGDEIKELPRGREIIYYV